MGINKKILSATEINLNEIKALFNYLEQSNKNSDMQIIITNDMCKKLYHLMINTNEYQKQQEQKINKLQEENENLREEDWAWHQVLKIQNKREYRSKFLKDFQKEHGTNTYPDYDEIYKRYDKLKRNLEEINCLIHKVLNDRDINGTGILNLNKILELTGGNNGKNI